MGARPYPLPGVLRRPRQQEDDPLAGYTPDWRQRVSGAPTAEEAPLAGYTPDWRERLQPEPSVPEPPKPVAVAQPPAPRAVPQFPDLPEFTGARTAQQPPSLMKRVLLSGVEQQIEAGGEMLGMAGRALERGAPPRPTAPAFQYKYGIAETAGRPPMGGRVPKAMVSAGERVAGAARERRAAIPRPAKGVLDPDATLEERLEALAFGVGEGLVSTVPSVVGGLAGAAVAGVPGAVVGAGAPAFALNASELRRELVESGVDEDRADRIAAAGSVPVTALDMIPSLRIVGRLTGTVRARAIRWAVGRAMADIADQGLLEGLTEGTQEFIQDAIAAQVTGRALDPRRYPEAALIGGAVGGLMGTGAHVVSRAAERPEAAAPAKDPLADYTPDWRTRQPEAPAPEAPRVRPAAPPAPERPGLRRRLADVIDPTRRAELEAALTDPMTGLPNQTAFEHTRARLDADPAYQVASLDLSNLKAINDDPSFGRQVADQRLAEVATVLQEEAARFGISARDVQRAGGDEFAVWGADPKVLRRVIDAAKARVKPLQVGEFTSHLRGGVGPNWLDAEAAAQRAKKVEVGPRARPSPAPAPAPAGLAPEAVPAPERPVTAPARPAAPPSGAPAYVPTDVSRETGPTGVGGEPSGRVGRATAPGQAERSPGGASVTGATRTAGRVSAEGGPAAGRPLRRTEIGPLPAGPPLTGAPSATPAYRPRGTGRSISASVVGGARGTESSLARPEYRPADAGGQPIAAGRPLEEVRAEAEAAAAARSEAAVPPEVSPTDIPLEVAERAHSGTSWTPERRAEGEQREYVRHMTAVWQQLQGFARTDAQRTTVAQEFARYRTDWVAKYQALLHTRSGLVSSMIAGPSGFPVERARKKGDAYSKRLGEFVAWDQRAQRAMAKAVRPERGPISADQPEAVQALQKKIAEAEQFQDRMKQANAIIREKGPTSDEKVKRLVSDVGLKETTARKALEPDFIGRRGFPDYALKNNLANIKRMQARVADLTRLRTEAPRSATFEGGRVEENLESNRIQVFFDEKPDETIRGTLKAHGFRWAPSEGAWQRQRNDAGRLAVQRVLGVTLSEAPSAPTEATTVEFTPPVDVEETAPTAPEAGGPGSDLAGLDLRMESTESVEQLRTLAHAAREAETDPETRATYENDIAVLDAELGRRQPAGEGTPIAPRRPPMETLHTGRTAEVVTPQGAHAIRYTLVEADQLVPSHHPQTFARNPQYPTGVQERPYERDPSEQMKVVRQTQQFDARFVLTDDPTAVNGPPIVTPSGIVVGGNSRAMTMQRMYQGDQGDALLQALRERAQDFGLEPGAIESMRQPVLVRVLAEEPESASLPELVRQFNEVPTQELGTAAGAVAQARRMSPETIGFIGESLEPTETVAQWLDRPGVQSDLIRRFLDDGVFTAQTVNRYATQGTLNREGRQFVERVLLGVVVRDAELLETAPANLLEKVSKVVGPIARAGEVGSEWDLRGLVTRALELGRQARRQGLTPDDLVGQGSLFGERIEPQAIQLLKLLQDEGTADLRRRFARFSAAAELARPAAQGQVELEGLMGPPPTPADGLLRAFDIDVDDFGGRVAEQTPPYGPETREPGTAADEAVVQEGLFGERDLVGREQAELFAEAAGADRTPLERWLDRIRTAEELARLRREGEEPPGERPMELFESEESGGVSDQRAKLVFGSRQAAEQAARLGREANRVPTFGERRAMVREERKGWVDLRGKRIATPADVSTVFRPFRSPKTETMHFALVDDAGQVLSHAMESSGAIDYIAWMDGFSKLAPTLARRARRVGATEVVLVHNHPSGNSTPSLDDRTITIRIQDELERQGHGLRVRHFVIDNDNVSEIRVRVPGMREAVDAEVAKITETWGPDAKSRNAMVWARYAAIGRLARSGVSIQTDRVTAPKRDTPDWTETPGHVLVDPQAVVDLAGRPPPGRVDVLYRGADGTAVAAVPHSLQAALQPERWLEAEARALGAVDAIFVLDARPPGVYTQVREAVQRYRGARAIQDVIGVEPSGTISPISARVNYGYRPFTRQPSRRARRIAEPGPAGRWDRGAGTALPRQAAPQAAEVAVVREGQPPFGPQDSPTRRAYQDALAAIRQRQTAERLQDRLDQMAGIREEMADAPLVEQVEAAFERFPDTALDRTVQIRLRQKLARAKDIPAKNLENRTDAELVQEAMEAGILDDVTVTEIGRAIGLIADEGGFLRVPGVSDQPPEMGGGPGPRVYAEAEPRQITGWEAWVMPVSRMGKRMLHSKREDVRVIGRKVLELQRAGRTATLAFKRLIDEFDTRLTTAIRGLNKGQRNMLASLLDQYEVLPTDWSGPPRIREAFDLLRTGFRHDWRRLGENERLMLSDARRGILDLAMKEWPEGGPAPDFDTTPVNFRNIMAAADREGITQQPTTREGWESLVAELKDAGRRVQRAVFITSPDLRRIFDMLQGRGGIMAYLPHVFKGDWVVRAGPHTARFVDREEGAAYARRLLEQGLWQEDLIVEREGFIPESALYLSRAQYFRLQQALKRELADEGAVVSKATGQAGIKLKPRRRWYAHGMKREVNLQTFERDLVKALTAYHYRTAKKLAFDPFRKVAVDLAESFPFEGGWREWAAGYIGDVQGVPHHWVELVNATLEQLGVKPWALQRAASRWQQLMSYWFLGYSPSTALINATQLAMNTIPRFERNGEKWVALGFHAIARSNAEDQAVLDYVGTKLTHPKYLAGEYLPRGLRINEDAWYMPMFMFNKTEDMNRGVTALARYYERRAAGLSKQAAMDEALEFTMDTHFDYSLADAPGILRNPVGRALFQFKTFPINQLFFAESLFRWGNARQRARFVAYLMAFGGLAVLAFGTPLWILDWLSGKTGLFRDEAGHKQTAWDELADQTRNAGVLWRMAKYGLLGAFGLDVSQRVGFGGPREFEIFGPRGIRGTIPGRQLELIARALRSENPTERAAAMRALLPAQVRRLVAAADASSTDVIRDRFGRIRDEDVSTTDIVALALGGQTIEQAETWRRMDREYQVTADYRRQRSNYLDRATTALRERGVDAAIVIVREAKARDITITMSQVREHRRRQDQSDIERRVKRTPLDVREDLFSPEERASVPSRRLPPGAPRPPAPPRQRQPR